MDISNITKYYTKLRDGSVMYHALLPDANTADAYIKQHDGVMCKKHTKEHLGRDAFIINNGELVFRTPVDGTIYSSVQHYELLSKATPHKKIPKKPYLCVAYTQKAGRIEYEELGQKQGRALLREAKGQPPFRDKVYKDYHLLPDGRVLMTIDYSPAPMAYFLFKNEKEALAYDQSWFKSSPIVFGRNPYGADFPQHVDELSRRLFKLLKLPLYEMDGSPRSIYKIEQKILAKPLSGDWTDPLFMPLIAYIGKMHQQTCGGEWVMVHDGLGTWSPDFVTPDGKTHLFYLDVWEFFDFNDPCTIALPKCSPPT